MIANVKVFISSLLISANYIIHAHVKMGWPHVVLLQREPRKQEGLLFFLGNIDFSSLRHVTALMMTGKHSLSKSALPCLEKTRRTYGWLFIDSSKVCWTVRGQTESVSGSQGYPLQTSTRLKLYFQIAMKLWKL